MHFRPPAKAIMALLPAGQQLILEPEPENPYDEFAVKVLLDHAELTEEHWQELEIPLLNYGMERSELEQEPIHLGYVARTHSQAMARTLASGRAYTAVLGFDPLKGLPQVIVTVE